MASIQRRKLATETRGRCRGWEGDLEGSEDEDGGSPVEVQIDGGGNGFEVGSVEAVEFPRGRLGFRAVLKTRRSFGVAIALK